MKKITILLTLLIIVSLLGIRNSHAQTSELISDPDFNKSELHETLSTKKIKAKKHNGALVFNYANDVVQGNKLRKNFTIEIEEGGEYFLSAYVNAVYDVPTEPDPKIKDKIYPLQEITVYFNDELLGCLDISKSGWCSSKLKKNKKLNLAHGKHVITFESDMPNTPNVDVIKLSTNYEKAEFDNSGYEEFLEKLKSNMDKNKNSKRKIEQAEVEEEAKKQIGLKSASNSSSDWEVSPYTLDMKGGNYKHKMNVPVVYTYYKKIYFSAGTYVDFHTQPNSPNSYYSVDPVMYLFSDDNFNNAWSNDDGYTGLQSRITLTIPSSGYYYLVVRAYSSYYASTATGMQGVVDIYKNGYIYQDDAPVSGYMVSVGTSNTGTLNFFTGYSTGIPKLWLAPHGYTNPIQFHGSTYWYVAPMDYYWFDDARFRIVKNTSSYLNMYLLVSSEGAWWVYWGNCDVYGSCKETTGIAPSSSFPNLKNSDAIQSAPTSGTYNCTAWTGGFTNGWVWHQYNYISFPIENDGTNQVWSTWDDYFGNNPIRYSGATTYTDDQANAYNAEIALWSTNGSYSGITHGSIRLVGNNHPHGYDWESKAGQNYRFFHPKNALENFNKDSYGRYIGYGGIFAYYRDASKDPYPYYSSPSGLKSAELRSAKSHSNEPVFTMEESIQKGLTVIEDIKLDADQMNLIRTKSVKLKSTSMLQTLYSAWVSKIHSPELLNVSNPYTFIETKEGKKLINYSKNNMEESITFFAETIFDNEEPSFEKYIAEYMFCEIAKEKYAPVMNEIKEEWKNNNYDNEGRYKAPMPETFTKKYIKTLLDNVVLKKTEIINQSDEKLFDNHSLLNISPNPVDDYASINLDLSCQSKVTIRVYSQSSLVNTIMKGKILEAGKYSFSLNASKLGIGVYVCIIEIDGVRYARKFLKR
ncbi:MAG: hypothetical protein PF486_09255 [Prolixibacteraceae bacterium]|jgi:hypothetical protein|nr:hypothetical protein [Prolixibacteraceae bacterium]